VVTTEVVGATAGLTAVVAVAAGVTVVVVAAAGTVVVAAAPGPGAGRALNVLWQNVAVRA
jgi:hypothetical protein